MIEAIQGGDRRALARALTLVQQGGTQAEDLLAAALAHWSGSSSARRVIGVTGPPGAGKSSLCDRFIDSWRAQGKRVAVLAVDPSSPFGGGALLGDRVRMARHTLDEAVFMRSVGARGALGGLAHSVHASLRLLAVAAFDVVLLETVGAGQSEVDVMFAADTVVLALMPGAGDQIQVGKAGILEIADIFLVNKSDRPGADVLAGQLLHMLAARDAASEWEAPVIACSAQTAAGIDKAVEAIAAHGAWLSATGQLASRRARQAEHETRRQLQSILEERLIRRFARTEMWRTLTRQVADGRATARQAALQAADALFPAVDDPPGGL